MPPTVLALSNALGYPNYRRRLNELQRLNFEVSHCGFDDNSGFGALDSSLEEVRLGDIQPGRYMKRFAAILSAVRGLQRLLSVKQPNVLWVFGVDMIPLVLIARSLNRMMFWSVWRSSRNERALLAAKFPPKFVYEVHDIRDLMLSPTPVGWLLRFLERQLLTKETLVIVTSSQYLDNYFEKFHSDRSFPTLVLENKLTAREVYVVRSSSRANKAMRNDEGGVGTIRIGYFGSLRCPYAWRAVLTLADHRSGQFEVLVRGVPRGLDRFEEDLVDHPRVHYGGPYSDPANLAELYGAVDIVWVAGFHGKQSHLWARTCRFYYACCFGVPLIGQIDTFDASEIERLGVGFSIDLSALDVQQQLVKMLTRSNIERWRKQSQGLPESVYSFSQDHDGLLPHLATLLDGVG